MPKKCAVCSHRDVLTINESLKHNVKTLKEIAETYGLHIQAVHRHRINHIDQAAVEKAAIAAPEADVLPEAYRPSVDKIDAYRDMIFLREKAMDLIAMVEAKENPTIYDMSIAMKELRENTKTMVAIYEAQRRIETEYSPPETIQNTLTYKFLRQKYPGVLLELVAHLKKEASQGQAR